MPDSIIDIRRMYQELDAMYGRREVDAVGAYLREKLKKTDSLGDTVGRLMVTNELLGYNRQYASPSDNRTYYTQIPGLIREAGLNGTADEGTILVNLATAMIADGRAPEALDVFDRAGKVLGDAVDADDRRMASYWNNRAAAEEAAGDPGAAERCYLAAESALSRNPYDPDLAVTWVNLASLYAGQDPCDERIQTLCEKCISALEESPYRDGYYYYTCRKCADPLMKLGFFAAARRFADIAPPVRT